MKKLPKPTIKKEIIDDTEKWIASYTSPEGHLYKVEGGSPAGAINLWYHKFARHLGVGGG